MKQSNCRTSETFCFTELRNSSASLSWKLFSYLQMIVSPFQYDKYNIICGKKDKQFNSHCYKQGPIDINSLKHRNKL